MVRNHLQKAKVNATEWPGRSLTWIRFKKYVGWPEEKGPCQKTIKPGGTWEIYQQRTSHESLKRSVGHYIKLLQSVIQQEKIHNWLLQGLGLIILTLVMICFVQDFNFCLQNKNQIKTNFVLNCILIKSHFVAQKTKTPSLYYDYALLFKQAVCWASTHQNPTFTHLYNVGTLGNDEVFKRRQWQVQARRS